ncbi:calcium/sodium antiporter [Patescibacteria group bacterium]|nr:calcium/sodium antiporter [Patescibacteria group bacterium]MBU1682810.1 calcium/sodium antiporter [Patescibacteria group bacterium]
MLTYILFILGFVFLIKGADLLVDGSSAIAKRLGVSNLVIGLTVVSFGTSAPELLVNVIASLQGASDIGIGNILGSNIANIFLILGVSALIYPLLIKRNTTWKEIPLNLLAAVVLFVMANDMLLDKMPNSILTRTDGFILIMFFVIFIYYTYGLAKSEKNGMGQYNHKPWAKAILMTIVGVIGLAFGGKWVVDGAVEIASMFGLSEVLIGLTIVAVGTSLPELATSAVAAYKRNTDIAVGNIVGSNIFNIFWVLGLSAMIKPMHFAPMINTDILVFVVATILLFFFSFTGKKRKHCIQRYEGGIFLACYVAYIVFLVMRG